MCGNNNGRKITRHSDDYLGQSKRRRCMLQVFHNTRYGKKKTKKKRTKKNWEWNGRIVCIDVNLAYKHHQQLPFHSPKQTANIYRLKYELDFPPICIYCMSQVYFSPYTFSFSLHFLFPAKVVGGGGVLLIFATFAMQFFLFESGTSVGHVVVYLCYTWHFALFFPSHCNKWS